MSVEKTPMIVTKSAETLWDPTDVNAGMGTDHTAGNPPQEQGQEEEQEQEQEQEHH